MKYIVKNCPACVISPSVCSEYHIKNGGKAKDCQDISDCLIKQVIEKCKEADGKVVGTTKGKIYDYDKKNLVEADVPLITVNPLATEIFNIFAIEECEE